MCSPVSTQTSHERRCRQDRGRRRQPLGLVDVWRRQSGPSWQSTQQRKSDTGCYSCLELLILSSTVCRWHLQCERMNLGGRADTSQSLVQSTLLGHTAGKCRGSMSLHTTLQGILSTKRIQGLKHHSHRGKDGMSVVQLQGGIRWILDKSKMSG